MKAFFNIKLNSKAILLKYKISFFYISLDPLTILFGKNKKQS